LKLKIATKLRPCQLASVVLPIVEIASYTNSTGVHGRREGLQHHTPHINGAIDAAWAQFDQSCHHEPMLSSEAPLLVLQRVSRDGQIARISVLQGQFSADIIGWYRGSVGLQPRHCRQTRAGHENYFRVIRLLFEINS
jgi:hypothetical protein